MKRRFTILTAALALLTFLAVPMGMWGQTRTEEVYKTSLFGPDYNSQGVSSYTGNSWYSTTNGFRLDIVNANNNNNQWSLIKIGGKNGAYTGKLTTHDVIDEPVTKVVLTIDAITTGNVTSMKLYSSSNNTSWTEIGTFSKSTGAQAVAINTPTANLYYKIEVACTKANNNGVVSISKVEYYHNAGVAYTITPVSSNASYGSVSLSGTTITATPNSGYRVIAGNGGYTVTAGTATVTNNGDNTFSVTPESDCTVQINFEAIPSHTITFNVGTGTCDTPTTSGYEGSTIVLPTAVPSQACVSRGWEFAGWATASVNETTTAPTLLNGDYTINGDATLYAVYKVTEGEGGTTEFNFASIAKANSWENDVRYSPVEISPITITASSNSGKFYTSDSTWRCYNNGSITITSSSLSITEVSSNPSKTFTINNGSASLSFTETTKFKSIIVTYGSATTTYNSNPSCLPMVATPTFTPAAGTYTGAQNVAIECDTDGATILYKTAEEGEWQTYSAAIPVSTTTTIWAKATNNGMDDSEVAEATYTIQYTLTVNIDDVVEYFLFDYHDGIWDEITLDENGQALVSSGADIRISGGEVKDDCYEFESFNVTDGNSPIAVNYISESVEYSFTMPASNATLTATLNEIADHYTLTVEGWEHVSLEMLVGSMSTITSLNANHQASICEGSEVTISELTVGIGYVLESVVLTYGGETVAVTTNEGGLYAFQMPSSNATLTFTVGEIPTYTYTLATSIESGKTYIIVGEDTGDYYAMGEQKTNNRGAYAISVDGNTATVSSAEVHEFVITALEGNDAGKYTIEDGGYLYAASSEKNYLRTEETLDANGKWTIEIEDGYATIIAQGSYTHNEMRFNANIQNGVANPLFACYAHTSSTGTVFRIFVKDEPATETYTLTVTGYADYSAKDGYCLIASPVTVDPATVEGMVVADTDPNYEYFDLYSFANDQDDEWQNYKYNQFNLVPGTGYLYAKKATYEGETFNFQLTGIPYSGDGSFELTNAGWNLVGNPFYANVTVDVQEFMIMNEDGSQIITSENSTIAPMQGIFVYANEDGMTVTFSPQQEDNANSNSNPSVVMNLTQNRGSVIDRAIVRFGEGRQMPKFQLFENSTKLYIQQDDEDYAIVRSEAQGELPVSFRASENGTYTLSMNVENIDMNYLHLIDNMTGMDIDLLQTPSYTFEANTNDYANRFKLVFAANGTDEADESSFAFFSNGNLIVNNEGNATLQVIDINGRILSSETISGSCSKAINATTGVYMLRLINGENVKVQKVVVR